MKFLFGLTLCLYSVLCVAVDSYDSKTKILSIPEVVIGNTVYKDVKLTIKSVDAVEYPILKTATDTYDTNTNQLFIPEVYVSDVKTYTNVLVTIDKVLAVGSSKTKIQPINDVVKEATISIDFSKYNTPGVVNCYYYGAGIYADLDNDGIDEFVIAVSPYPQVLAPISVLEYKNGPKDATTKYFPDGKFVTKNTKYMFFEDVNGDGLKDLVAAEAGLDAPPWTGSKINIALNKGGTFESIYDQIPDTNLRNYSIAVGNFLGDGKKRILIPLQNGQGARGDGAILKVDGKKVEQVANPIKNWQINMFDYATTKLTADFNRDGFDDVLISGSNTGRTNVILYGTKDGLDKNIPNLKTTPNYKNVNVLPEGPLSQSWFEWEWGGGVYPPKKVTKSAEVNSLVFDFDGDGYPDIFSMSKEVDYFPPGVFTDTASQFYSSSPKGGIYSNGKSQYSTLKNTDGYKFISSAPLNSDLGKKYYANIVTFDVNNDGYMDVVGHYWTEVHNGINGDLLGSVWGTTFFLNDGKGNFTVVDALDAFPQLALRAFTTQSRPHDNRYNTGSIIPVTIKNGEFIGYQMFKKNDGTYTVQSFRTKQYQNLKP